LNALTFSPDPEDYVQRSCKEQPAGEHYLIWNGRDDSGHCVASGLYLSRIACNGRRETRKMLLLK
ncbi:MAG TPA: hypothetical protein PLQ80_10215, partial [Candidatus Syntrophosphaera sp.]|nr:hypothetical protein [Candidatus Syntrophosphaera sp.]HPH61094.1 hypothetical protein [Candidatus Syntrophosphaera sp.]